MTTDIELHQGFNLNSIAPLSDFAQTVARTPFVPKDFIGKPEAVLACFMTGQELGISPMQSLRQIHVIEGRPALSAELMRSLIQRAGHEIWFGREDDQEFTTRRVTCYGRRKGSSVEQSVTWTMDMAKAAGLDGRQNWRKHPRNMLAARATSELARLLFADVIAGIGFTPEELEDGDVAEAQIVEETPAPRPKAKTRQLRSKAAPAKAATPPPAPPLPGEEEDEVIDAEVVEEETKPSQDDALKERRKKVRSVAFALGIDHHPVVHSVTGGRTQSSNDLSDEEAKAVLKLLHRIADGEVEIENGEIIDRSEAGDPFEAPADDAFPEEAEVGDDPETWGMDEWRGYLKTKGVGIPAVIREAHRLTPNGSTPPGNIGSIKGTGLAADLVAFVEAQA